MQFSRSALRCSGAVALALGLALLPAVGSAEAPGPAAPAPDDGAAATAPDALPRLGQRVIFTALDPGIGLVPFVTNGRPGGTRRIDLLADGVGAGGYDYAALGNGRVVFGATHPELGVQAPFVSRGGLAGTRVVVALPETERGPAGFVAMGGGRAFFRTVGPQGAVGLWVTNGRPRDTSGTRQLETPERWDFRSTPRNVTRFNRGVLFSSFTEGEGFEPWIYSGGDTVRLVANINRRDPLGSQPQGFADLGNGRAVFKATHPRLGRELFSTTGTGARVIDINPGPIGSFPRDITPIGGGRALMSAGAPFPELWITNGRPRGTRMIYEFQPGRIGGGDPRGFAQLRAGQWLFAATTPDEGRELWITDGTTAGTRLVRDIWPGGSSAPEFITPMGNGRAVFWVRDPATTGGNALWVTDGTPRGTRRVRHFPDAIFPYRGKLTGVGNGRAVFSNNQRTRGWEPWTTDGTRRGTRLLRYINPDFQSFPRQFTRF